ncbi:MAG: winged helix-turn-helix domain-containing protein [Pseudomonadota bacterium]
MTALRDAILALPPQERLGAALDLIDDLTGASVAAVLALRQRYGLTSREAAVMDALNRASPRALGREQLLLTVWGHDSEVGDKIVDVYITKLRAKLGRDVIRTVWGSGWVLDRQVAA